MCVKGAQLPDSNIIPKGIMNTFQTAVSHLQKEQPATVDSFENIARQMWLCCYFTYDKVVTLFYISFHHANVNSEILFPGSLLSNTQNRKSPSPYVDAVTKSFPGLFYTQNEETSVS